MLAAASGLVGCTTVYKSQGICHAVTAHLGSAVRYSALQNESAYLQVTNLDDFVDVMDDVGRAFGYKTRPLSMTLGEFKEGLLLPLLLT